MIEPSLGLNIVIWGGWILLVLGITKVLLWLIG